MERQEFLDNVWQELLSIHVNVSFEPDTRGSLKVRLVTKMMMATTRGLQEKEMARAS